MLLLLDTTVMYNILCVVVHVMLGENWRYLHIFCFQTQYTTNLLRCNYILPQPVDQEEAL